MKKFFLPVVLLLPCLVDAKELPFYHPPAVQRETLSNGMTVLLLEDHELPTAQLTLLIRGGSLFDPKGKEGLASIALQAIREGGTVTRKPEAVEEELEFFGGALEVEAAQEWLQVSLHLLEKDRLKGMEILFDLLRHPSIDPHQFEILKKRAGEALLREADEPLSLALRKFPHLVYGEKSLWGRSPTPASLKKIDRKDVVRFQEAFLAPDRILLAASGDFNAIDFLRELKIQTAGWAPRGFPLAPAPEVNKTFAEENWFLPVKGLAQATIVTGHFGEKRSNPDKYPLLVMNYILGGSGALSSHLGEKIRVQGGKAYSVWSSFGFAEAPGLFSAVAQTAAAQTEEVVHDLKEAIGSFPATPITDEELSRAKQVLLRSFLFNYETSDALVKDLAKFQLWGYPENYIDLFQQEIQRLTKDDVERVAKQYLHPEGLKTLVVGANGHWKGKWRKLH